jgi:hypothetical protein
MVAIVSAALFFFVYELVALVRWAGATRVTVDGVGILGSFDVARFLASTFSVVAGILMISTLTYLLRRTAWGEPLDLVSHLALYISRTKSPMTTVNVEFRDASGALMDLGPFIEVTLRSGHGRSYSLQEGVFIDSHPDWIKVGASVDISIQDGLVREFLTVQIDFEREILFVKSHFKLGEVVAQINRTTIWGTGDRA